MERQKSIMVSYEHNCLHDYYYYGHNHFRRRPRLQLWQVVGRMSICASSLERLREEAHRLIDCLTDWMKQKRQQQSVLRSDDTSCTALAEVGIEVDVDVAKNNDDAALTKSNPCNYHNNLAQHNSPQLDFNLPILPHLKMPHRREAR